MRHRLATLQPSRTALAALACLAAAACVPKSEPAPAPAPTPTPAPSPAPAPVPPPFAGNWMDAPLTPGDWHYSQTQVEGDAVTAATFSGGGGEMFAVTCYERQEAIRLQRIVDVANQVPTVPMTVRTETADRAFNARQWTGRIFAELNPADRILDAMAFSKGRFVIEVAGQPTLYIPSYPEVTRVIEDCR